MKCALHLLYRLIGFYQSLVLQQVLVEQVLPILPSMLFFLATLDQSIQRLLLLNYNLNYYFYFFITYATFLYSVAFFANAHTTRAFLFAIATQVRLAPLRSFNLFIQRLRLSSFLEALINTDLAP